MELITRTVYGSYLQSCLLLGLPFQLVPNTTLNEKFNIQSGVAPNEATPPDLQYFCLGNGGHRYVVGANGIAKPEPIQHKATDAALFNHLPFVLREPALDLTAAERANYALRREETHNGRTYIAYYLKRMDLSNTTPKMEYRVVDGGNTAISAFTPTAANLNPTPPVLTSSGVNTTTGDYVATAANVALSLSAADMQELLNVSAILYDDEEFAIISEIGLCSGVDKIVQAMSANGAFNYNEAIAVQIASHFSMHIAAKFNNNGADIELSIGSAEPLFKLA